jgi:2,4-diketo-3-deoxy-L-fuconate hydrolase
MKLVSFGPVGAEQPGLLRDEETIVPLGPLLAAHGVAAADMNAVLGLLPALAARPHDRVPDGPATVPLAATRLGPPVPRPAAVVAVGGNYRDHLAQFGASTAPTRPVLFPKAATSITGPRDDIVVPRETAMLDYECELGVVIGRAGRRIPRETALDHVAGYLIANDVTARDVFLGESAVNPLYLQIMRGKGYDSFCPTGPWLVTPDEFGDPATARLRTWVNGELRQDGSAADMIFDVAELIASVSEFCTLRPGVIILTGSPAGVGYAMQPPQFLVDGDDVRMEITGLGELANAVRAEK